MDPGQLPAMFAAIEVRAGDASSPASLALADTFQKAVRRTLSLRSRGAVSFRSPGERGQPPAMRSGRLRNSVAMNGGGGFAVSSAWVAPMVFYAGVQEWGHTMHASPGGYMHFISGGRWWLKEVHVGPNPYMRPTLRACIGDGSLGRNAAQAFSVAVWGR